MPGARSAPSSGAPFRTPPGITGWSRSTARDDEDGTLLVEAPGGLASAGSAKRYGRLLAGTCAERVLGAERQGRRGRGRRAGGDQTRARPAAAATRRRRRDRARRARSTRATRSTSSSSATRTASRTPPRSPSPRCPASPTTRCSSAARRVSARRTCCTRSPTTCTAYGAGATVRYTTAEAFTNHFVHSLRGGDRDAFKAAYRGVDVLLVDDVQFLQEKARTEEEFFHTFNALHQAGAQIVLTSDRLPRDLDALEDAPARALRGRPGHRRRRARPRHAPDDPAQARPAGRRRRHRPGAPWS